jgi:hypothetical protein
MQGKVAFGVVVRTIGLLLLFVAILYLIDGMSLLLIPDIFRNFHPIAVAPPYSYLASGLFSLIVGVYLLRGAKRLVRFAYPENSN